MHTQRHTRGPYVQDTCAGARTHHTHANTRTQGYKLGGYVLQHLFTMGYPSCPADVILRTVTLTCTHIHNNNCLLYTNMVYIKNKNKKHGLIEILIVVLIIIEPDAMLLVGLKNE